MRIQIKYICKKICTLGKILKAIHKFFLHNFLSRQREKFVSPDSLRCYITLFLTKDLCFTWPYPSRKGLKTVWNERKRNHIIIHAEANDVKSIFCTYCPINNLHTNPTDTIAHSSISLVGTPSLTNYPTFWSCTISCIRLQ